MKFAMIAVYVCLVLMICYLPNICFLFVIVFPVVGNLKLYTLTLAYLNRPFYRYGGHIELIGFNEYYGMPRGHEHDLIYWHQFLRALFGPIFL